MAKPPTRKEHDLIPLTHVDERILSHLEHHRGRVQDRFPLGIALLGTFGFVATLYGFEKVIDKISFFGNHPWILLVTGLVILAVTGTIFTKLDD